VRDSRLACHFHMGNCIEATPVPVKPTQYPDFFDPFFALPFFFGSDVLVVSLVLIVPMDPAVPLVSVDVMTVAEVSVDDIVLDVTVDDVSVVDIVLVIPVSVAAVSVLAFSSFLQPNAKIAIARSERTVSERDFFISFSLLNFAGKRGRNVSAARSRGAIV
jgi:hypothetical protein